MRAPPTERLRRGVPTATGQHLLTMILTDKGWLVADSARLWEVAVELGVVERGGGKEGPHPFADPLGTRRVIERVIGRDRARGVESSRHRRRDPGRGAARGAGRLWDLRGLGAADLAAALAEGGPFAHLLRFTHTDPERQESGGYSVTVVG